MGGWFLGGNSHEWQGWVLGFSLDNCWLVYMEVPAQWPWHSFCPCQGRWSERNRNEKLGCLSQRVNDPPSNVFRALEPPSETPPAVWYGGSQE